MSCVVLLLLLVPSLTRTDCCVKNGPDMILRPTTIEIEAQSSPDQLRRKVIVKGAVECPELEDLMWMKSKKFTKFTNMFETAKPWNVCSYTEKAAPLSDARMGPYPCLLLLLVATSPAR